MSESNDIVIEGDNITIKKNDKGQYVIHGASLSGLLSKAEYDKNKTGSVDNADKVNNHSVESDVPVDAKFTDTTYKVRDGELSEINFTEKSMLQFLELMKDTKQLKSAIGNLDTKHEKLKTQLLDALDKYLNRNIKDYDGKFDKVRVVTNNISKIIESHTITLDDIEDQLELLRTDISNTNKTIVSTDESIVSRFNDYINIITELENKIANFKTNLSSKMDDIEKSDAFNKPFGKVAKTIAEGNHTHELNLPNFSKLYAVKQHAHLQYSKEDHIHNNYSKNDHTHQELASIKHNHDDRYVTIDQVNQMLQNLK